jgi:hypothetical protein
MLLTKPLPLLTKPLPLGMEEEEVAEALRLLFDACQRMLRTKPLPLCYELNLYLYARCGGGGSGGGVAAAV